MMPPLVTARRLFSLLLSSFLLFTLIVLPFAPNAPVTIAYAQHPTQEAYQQRQDAESHDSEQQEYSSQELVTPEAQLEQRLKTEQRAKSAGEDKDDEFDKESKPDKEARGQNDPCREMPQREDKLKKHCFEAASSSNGVTKGDFNHDGFADLAIGVPGEDITFDNGTTAVDAGAVNIIYGSVNGLTSTDTSVPRPRIFSQSSPGVPDSSETGDNFGRTLVAGDFNDDGFSDLVVGIPNEDIVVTDRRPFGSQRLVKHAGAFIVLLGSENGLNSDLSNPLLAARVFNQDTFLASYASTILFVSHGFPCGRKTCMTYDDIHDHDHFGATMSWGRFNFAGLANLVVGAPDQDFVDRNTNFDIDGQTQLNAGAVYIFYSLFRDAGRISADIIFQEDVTNHVNDTNVSLATSEENDHFGSALVSGDFVDERSEIKLSDDLVIGASGEDTATLANRGAIYVIFGRRGNQFDGTFDTFPGCENAQLQYAQSAARDCGVADRIFGNAAELRLGNVLATGDFNGFNNEGADDIAAGVPNATVQGQAAAGAVHIFNGTGRSSFDSSPSFVITQSINGSATNGSSINGGPEAGDRFGSALAVGNFHSISFSNRAVDDLVIGTPFEDIAINGITFNNYGAVQIIEGSVLGISQNTRDFFLPPLSIRQNDANFGFSLTAWDFGLNINTRGTVDLAVGVPGRNVGTVRNAGEVTVFYARGTSPGFPFDTRVDFWNQSSTGIPGGAEANDRFGEALY